MRDFLPSFGWLGREPLVDIESSEPVNHVRDEISDADFARVRRLARGRLAVDEAHMVLARQPSRAANVRRLWRCRLVCWWGWPRDRVVGRHVQPRVLVRLQHIDVGLFDRLVGVVLQMHVWGLVLGGLGFFFSFFFFFVEWSSVEAEFWFWLVECGKFFFTISPL